MPKITRLNISMAERQNKNVEDLPKVLVLGLHKCYASIIPHYSHKFHFLDPKLSGLSLHHFIVAHNHQPSSIPAILCSTTYSISADVLRLLPSLRLVVTTSSGTDHIDLNECRRRGIQVAAAGGVFSEDVADMAVALLIDVVRKISAGDRYLRTQNHSTCLDFPLVDSKLSCKRVGIVGLGSIGMEVAKRLEGFGCIISYHSKHQKAVSYPFFSNVTELATTCNALVVCCALNEETKHIINKDVILALGKEGFIVNVGRGALIDEKQLVKCLMEGQIGGAGLDVFENEPRVPEELLEMNNVVLSAHHAAATAESKILLIELVIGNLEAFFSNKPLISPVILVE
ncbi:glyoxylate/hydroxypyruvate reductase HPR3-like [Abrus precatorius]|uniref:glyoxylate reductase (NADP(+)) n=1 Tax=Abrus precatorius TaxID=3816 RepID=A0A8B8K1K0_ABRPR|nr:glyoxylate/hydroxypyruvate reductase HPR3-like [Abrus precatorius]